MVLIEVRQLFPTGGSLNWKRKYFVMVGENLTSVCSEVKYKVIQTSYIILFESVVFIYLRVLHRK